jgi:hypothetical protein
LPINGRHLTEIVTGLHIGENNVAPDRSAHNNPQRALGQEIRVRTQVALMEQALLGLNSTPVTAGIKHCDLGGIERTKNPYALKRLARRHLTLLLEIAIHQII